MGGLRPGTFSCLGTIDLSKVVGEEFKRDYSNQEKKKIVEQKQIYKRFQRNLANKIISKSNKKTVETFADKALMQTAKS